MKNFNLGVQFLAFAFIILLAYFHKVEELGVYFIGILMGILLINSKEK